jgi:hypothetical protein
VKTASLNSGPGKAVAVGAVCGLILLLSLFGSWAQIVCELEPCQYPSGWEVLLVLDVPIALLAVAAIVLGVLAIVRPIPLVALGLAVAGLASVIIVLVVPFVEDRGVRPVDFGGSWFLGLLAALGVLVAGLLGYFLLRPSRGDAKDDDGAAEDEG